MSRDSTEPCLAGRQVAEVRKTVLSIHHRPASPLPLGVCAELLAAGALAD